MIKLIVMNQQVVNEFKKDFHLAYKKYFENKSYVVQNGRDWSVIVGFCIPYIYKTDTITGWHYLTIELDISLLITYYQSQKKSMQGLKDNRGEDKYIQKMVSADVIAFINDVMQMSGHDFEISASHALKGFDRLQIKRCQICNREFYGLAKSKYCSNACRCKAKRQKKQNNK
ncbi:hypothetical protein [Caldisericum sp.]|uniref:hypothetical protein n=1 Tax=Caldisericum sp. TaxID=2499687 RepID=UPI003D0B2087